MKTIKIQRDITLPEISRIKISNELMGTSLVQSADEAIHITAELYLRMDDEDEEITAEDFITVKTDEKKGSVTIEIEELDLDTDDYDLSHRSTLTIALPAQARIEAETDNYYLSAVKLANDLGLTNENGPIKAEEITGTVSILNENGPIKLFKIEGNLSIQQENGPISADNLSGTSLDVKSENGSVKLRECQFEEVIIRNENGMVYYESLPVESGSLTIQNENGHINLALSPLQGFSLEARAELGQIKNNFMGQENTMFDTYKLEVGDNGLKIKLSTENGMIKLSSSDMLGSDFFRGKLDYIRELLKNNTEQGLAEAHKIIGQLIAGLNKLLDKAKDEAVKEKIEQALARLKAWKAEVSNPELQETVKDSFNSISADVGRSVQEALKAAQEAMITAKEKYREEFKPQFDKQFDKGREFFRNFKGFAIPPIPPVPPIPSSVKDAMQEKARMKILDMLESGKINSEEAEKLLKAIH
jgi:hypothetical protein